MDKFEYYWEEMLATENAEIRLLQEKVQSINSYLQDLTDFLGAVSSENEKFLKINFPYGYIRTASTCREELKCVDNQNTKSNIAYSLMLSDLFTWLVNRTNIQGTLQEMIIKNEILVMASICETLSVLKVGKGKNYNQRIEKLFNQKIISEKIMGDLLWLWEIRVGVHIYELNKKEYQKYTIQDFLKAKETTKQFIIELNADTTDKIVV